jgi:CRISPR-associated Csx2 family protein
MARKVLISFLGAGDAKGNYRSAIYRIDNKLYNDRKFIASALQEHYKVDIVILIGTMRSLWDSVYDYYATKTNNYQEAIHSQIFDNMAKSNYNTPLDNQVYQSWAELMGKGSQNIVIHYGLTSKEVEDNLKIMLGIEQYLENNDELFIDITNGFRSLSIFMQAVISYLKNISPKNVNIGGIFYGMLDVTREFEDGITPVVRLDILNELIDWTKAAFNLQNYGNGLFMADLIRPINENQANKVENLTKAIQLGYAPAVKDAINSLSAVLNNLPLAASLVIPKASDELNKLLTQGKKDSQFQLLLAEWYCNKKMYALSYIVLAEAIVTYVCEGENYDIVDKELRDTAKSLLKDKSSKYKKNLNPKDEFKTINNIRNNIAHASLENRSVNFLNDANQLTQRISKYKNIFFPKK